MDYIIDVETVELETFHYRVVNEDGKHLRACKLAVIDLIKCIPEKDRSELYSTNTGLRNFMKKINCKSCIHELYQMFEFERESYNNKSNIAFYNRNFIRDELKTK